MSLEELIRVAQGEQQPDLVLKHGRVVNVFSNEIYYADVAIYKDRIAGVGEYSGSNEIELDGQIVAPGFIDGHVHIESSMVRVPEFARAVVPRGTTTVIIDPHEIANVLGSDGIFYMLKSSKYNPLSVYMMLPSCVPATHLETAGSELKAIDLFPLFSDKWVIGLGEIMNYPAVLRESAEVLDKIKIAGTKPIDGHAPGVAGKQLCAYIASGIRSDHECTSVEEAQERLRLGMHVMIREGSTTRNLREIIKLVTPSNISRCFFVTDDRHPEDLLEEGHIDHLIKLAIEEGIDPVLAIRMATINTAEYFSLENLGAVAPGYIADLVVIDDLFNFEIKKVFKNGELIAENGVLKCELPPPSAVSVRSSVNVKWLEKEDFKIPVRGRRCRIIGYIPQQITTEYLEGEPLIVDEFVCADTDKDVLKLMVIERHNASGNIGRGLIKGFGLKKGALASSVAHDSHNIVVIGTNDEDIFTAAVQVIKMQGGLVVVADGKVINTLPLPIAGLISEGSLVEVRDKLKELHYNAEQLGVTAEDPFMALSFLCLPVIPALKLTDKGLVDVAKFELVDLFVDS